MICNTGDFCHAIQRNFCHLEVPRFKMQFIKHTLFFFYKNIFYKSIEVEIREILRIF